MSREADAAVLKHRVGHPVRKLILFAESNVAHADGRHADEFVARIAEYAECSERTVQRHLLALLADGFLRLGDQQRVAHLDPRNRPTVYDIAMTVEQAQEWAAEYRRTQGAGSRREKFAEAGRRGGQAAARNRAARDAEAALAGIGDDPAEFRGDNLTPPVDNPGPQVSRGDRLTPPVDNSGQGCHSSVTPRGDSQVSPTYQGQTLKDQNQPPPAHASGHDPAPLGTPGGRVVVGSDPEHEHPDPDGDPLAGAVADAEWVLGELLGTRPLAQMARARLAARLVERLHAGWTPAVLLAELDTSPLATAANPYGVLNWRIDQMRDVPTPPRSAMPSVPRPAPATPCTRTDCDSRDGGQGLVLLEGRGLVPCPDCQPRWYAERIAMYPQLRLPDDGLPEPQPNDPPRAAQSA